MRAAVFLLFFACNGWHGGLGVRVENEGELYRAYVTCPRGETGYRFFLFQGTTTGEILDASHLECGKDVPLGAFRVKRGEPATVCIARIDNFFVTLRSLPREHACQKID